MLLVVFDVVGAARNRELKVETCRGDEVSPKTLGQPCL